MVALQQSGGCARLRAFIAHDVLRFATLVAIAAFLIDWASKSWALTTLGDMTMPLGALVLGVERNEAFAFSSGSGRFSPAVVIAVRLLALAAVVLMSRRVGSHSRRYAAGFALLIAGGFGNAADVMFRGGAVVDFIGAGPFRFEWLGEVTHFGFVFNAADISILLGLALIAPQIQTWSLKAQRNLGDWEERWLWSDVNTLWTRR
jgi:lipoprotein signal peptidase